MRCTVTMAAATVVEVHVRTLAARTFTLQCILDHIFFFGMMQVVVGLVVGTQERLALAGGGNLACHVAI